MLFVRQLRMVVGVDFSVEEQYVFWSDIFIDFIFRVFVNGLGWEIIIDGEWYECRVRKI